MSRSAAATARRGWQTASRRDLPIAFGGREVLVRCDDPEVMDSLERIFSMMGATGSGRKVGELEVYRADGRYAVRGNGDVTLEDGSLADVVRCVRYAAIQLLIDARPELLSFHAGAAAFRGQTVIFPGARGCGKSTLVTRLCTRNGWSYLSDDIAPVDHASDDVLPFPQAPAVRRYPGQDMPPAWLRIPNKAEPEAPPASVCREPTPVAAVVRPFYRRDAGAVLSLESPATTALHLLEQCCNFPSHRETALGYVCGLVQRVPGFSVSFSDGEAAADVVARELEGRF